MDLLNLLMGHAAKRGTHELTSLLEAEGDVDVVQLLVLGEVVHEPAHDVGLLGLGEAPEAVVHADLDDFALLRQEEGHSQVEPGLDLLVALLPVVVLDEPGFPPYDHDDVAALHRQVLLRGVLHGHPDLLLHQLRELDPLGNPPRGLHDLPPAGDKSAGPHVLEELHVASIEEVVLRELHGALDVFAVEVSKVDDAVQVLHGVLGVEVDRHRLAMLVHLRLLLEVLLGELVQLLQQGLHIFRGIRNVLGIPLLPLLLLNLLLLSLLRQGL